MRRARLQLIRPSQGAVQPPQIGRDHEKPSCPVITTAAGRRQRVVSARSNTGGGALVGWPGGVSPPGSLRSGRDSLPSPGSCHLRWPEVAGPAPVCEQVRMPFGDPLPARFGFLEPAQPFVFLADPPHQVGVDAVQEGMQRRAVKRAVVLHPAANDRVDRLGQLGEGERGPPVQPPRADRPADLVQGVCADRGQERREADAMSVSGLAGAVDTRNV
jgi:hypothetical protein